MKRVQSETREQRRKRLLARPSMTPREVTVTREDGTEYKIIVWTDAERA